MQLGEGVTEVDIASENHDEDCYFCKSPPQLSTEVNDLTDDFDEDQAAEMEDSLGEYEFHNSSGKLGTALGGKPDSKTVTLNGKNYTASVAAHHLIPGNASLKESELMEYLWKDGSAEGNIGYNVNAKPNGVWLTGNYGVRPWGKLGKKFEEDSGLKAHEFAFAAMDEWRCQFHDAHEDYSEFVAGVLEKIADKLELNKTIWCPEQAKKNEDKPTQMFQLVGRLNSVSLRMKRMLVFPTTNWKSNIYTSRFVKQYMKEMDHRTATTDPSNLA